jgi:hypothetical protein
VLSLSTRRAREEQIIRRQVTGEHANEQMTLQQRLQICNEGLVHAALTMCIYLNRHVSGVSMHLSSS